MFYVLGDFLLYISIALVIGLLFLNLVPEDRKPKVMVTKKQLTWLIAAVVFFSAFPVVNLIIYFVTELKYDVGFVTYRVLRDYNVGHGWIMTVIFALLLGSLVYQRIETKHERLAAVIQLVLSIGMLAGVGYASHSAGLYGYKGFATHSIHLLGVSLWLGILMAVSWFTRGSDNWKRWLAWMSPLAVTCFVVTVASGIVVMLYLSDNYVEGLVVPFGQALLIKHALLLPLIALAITNGFGLRRRLMKEPGFNPLTWLRMESVLALTVFFGTAYLSQQAPPHDLNETLANGEVSVSNLWSFFNGQDLAANAQITFQFSALGIVFSLLAIVMATLGIGIMIKRRELWFSFNLLLCSALSLYLAAMLSVHSVT
ncbi:copper resistance D family protein [Paenibacillus sp. B01]|uniref:copper resistance D family protein n=1 Tax=Paenibacillus sp. B01 TaxID=2660554 RepID=UPI00129AA31A|nr:CopD family protein [Paenibacillus sp. B01]QGG55052.1 hypothetical protein GE073_05285 [Paenibacillus sp. B01]